MAKDTTKTVISCDDLKIALDDIYSRLDKMASKKDLSAIIDRTIRGLERKEDCDDVSTQVGNVNDKIKKLYDKKTVTLSAANWDANKQQEINGFDNNTATIILISLSVGASNDIVNEFKNAGIIISSQLWRTITLKCTGTKPTKDLKIDLLIFNKQY